MSSLGDIIKRRILEKVEHEYENLKDSSVFELNVEPRPEFTYVRPEVNMIVNTITDYIVTGIPQHILLLGWRGSGKTTSVLTVIRTIKELSEELRGKNIFLEKYFYVNAREHPSQREIFETIIGKSFRGFSFSEILNELYKVLEGRTILVIDEVDFLQSNEIFYHISRSTKVSMIAIAQNVNWFKSLDSSIQSSFRPTPIFFKNYDASQLKEILMLRAKYGLKHYDESGIALIGAIVANNHYGDARIGIRALYYVGKQDKWDDETIKQCVETAVKEVEAYTLNNLSIRDLVILSTLTEQSDTNVAYGIILERLRALGYYTFGKATYFRALNFLQNLGIITLVKKKVSKYYTYEVQVLVPKELIMDAIKKNIQKM